MNFRICCHRRLGKQAISRHKKGLDKICEQCLYWQIIKRTGTSNVCELRRLDQRKRPGTRALPEKHLICSQALLSGSACPISVNVVLEVWGTFQALLGPSKPVAQPGQMASTHAATPLPSRALGSNSIYRTFLDALVGSALSGAALEVGQKPAWWSWNGAVKNKKELALTNHSPRIREI